MFNQVRYFRQKHDRATVRIILRKRNNKAGLCTLGIRIIKDRKPSYEFLEQKIDPKDWDDEKQRVKKSHPNSGRLNALLMRKLSEINDKLLETEYRNDGITAKAIAHQITSKKIPNSFFQLAETYLLNFSASGKYNRFFPDRSRIRNFRSYLNDKEINFQDITIDVLNGFKTFLKMNLKASDRSIVNHLIIIRTIYNMAIKNKLVDAKYYPFGKDQVQIKLPNTIKIGLSIEEVRKIEALNLDQESYTEHCRRLWLFSFYFAGMRISDVLRLRWSDFQNDRLTYKMGKNDKVSSLMCPEKALQILSNYRKNKMRNDDIIFPELRSMPDMNDKYEVQRKTSYAVKRIDDHLRKVAQAAGIEKSLTMHIARHTFGNISGDKISIQMLQKLYRHSSITTTIGYQSNFIHRDADDALMAVIES